MVHKYEYPLRLKGIGILGISLFWGLPAYGFWYEMDLDRNFVVTGSILICFGIVYIPTLWRSFDRFEISDAGLRFKSLGSESVVHWSASIRTEFNPFGHLVLTSASGDRVVVGSDVEGYPDFLVRLEENLPGILAPPALPLSCLGNLTHPILLGMSACAGLVLALTVQLSALQRGVTITVAAGMLIYALAQLSRKYIFTCDSVAVRTLGRWTAFRVDGLTGAVLTAKDAESSLTLHFADGAALEIKSSECTVPPERLAALVEREYCPVRFES